MPKAALLQPAGPRIISFFIYFLFQTPLQSTKASEAEDDLATSVARLTKEQVSLCRSLSLSLAPSLARSLSRSCSLSRICVRVTVHVCVCVFACAYLLVCYVYMHACMHARVDVCTCVCASMRGAPKQQRAPTPHPIRSQPLMKGTRAPRRPKADHKPA